MAPKHRGPASGTGSSPPVLPPPSNSTTTPAAAAPAAAGPPGGGAGPSAPPAAAAAVASAALTTVGDARMRDLLELKIAQLEAAELATKGVEAVEADGTKANTFMTPKERQELQELLASDVPAEEKIAQLKEKYMQQTKRAGRLGQMCTKLNAEIAKLSAEAAAMHEKHERVTAMNAKLEALCRELQKQYTDVMRDSREAIAVEANKREQMQRAFQSKLDTLKHDLDTQWAARSAQLAASEERAVQLETLVQKLEAREQSYQLIVAAKDKEVLLLNQKHKAELESISADAMQLDLYRKQLAESQAAEETLRTQVTSYADHFQRIQESITASTELLNTLKRELDSSRSANATLTLELTRLKERAAKTDVALVETVQDRNTLRGNVQTLNTKLSTLQNLCRALQKQNAELKAGAAPASEVESTNDTASAEPATPAPTAASE